MGAKVGTKGPIADINVTPLIDVVLVLLVVFMVITPMLQSGMPVDLPSATATKTVSDVGQHIVISITKDNGVWVDQESTTEDTVVGMVMDRFRDNPQREILVKADASLPYSEVRRWMDLLAENGWSDLLVATRKEE